MEKVQMNNQPDDKNTAQAGEMVSNYDRTVQSKQSACSDVPSSSTAPTIMTPNLAGAPAAILSNSSGTSGTQSSKQQLELGKRSSFSIKKFKNEVMKLCDPKTKFDERICILMSAWRNVAKIMETLGGDLPSDNILHWVLRHTLHTMLMLKWDTVATDNKEYIKEQISHCMPRVTSPNYTHRCKYIHQNIEAPWSHPMIAHLLNGSDDDTSRLTEEIDYFAQERGCMIALRLQKLCDDTKCSASAYTFASKAMRAIRSVRATPTHTLTRSVSESQYNFIFDVYLALSFKFNTLDKCVEELKALNLDKSLKLLLREPPKAAESPKLFKLHKKVVALALTVFVTTSMMHPLETIEDEQHLAGILTEWIKSNRNGASFIEETKKLIAMAETQQHVFILCCSLQLSCAQQHHDFILEATLHCLINEVNRWETLKTYKACDTNSLLENERKLAPKYLFLADVLDKHLHIAQECVLTAFSLDPNTETFRHVRMMALKLGLCTLADEPDLEQMQLGTILNNMPIEDCANHPKIDVANIDSDQHTILCPRCGAFLLRQRSQPLCIDSLHSITGLYILKSNNYNEMEAPSKLLDQTDGIEKQTCTDISTIMSAPRIKTFSWMIKWPELRATCVKMLSAQEKYNFVKQTIATANDHLEHLKLDYSKFLHLPDNDYGGVEPGYELFPQAESDSPPSTPIKKKPQKLTHKKSKGEVVRKITSTITSSTAGAAAEATAQQLPARITNRRQTMLATNKTTVSGAAAAERSYYVDDDDSEDDAFKSDVDNIDSDDSQVELFNLCETTDSASEAEKMMKAMDAAKRIKKMRSKKIRDAALGSFSSSSHDHRFSEVKKQVAETAPIISIATARSTTTTTTAKSVNVAATNASTTVTQTFSQTVAQPVLTDTVEPSNVVADKPKILHTYLSKKKTEPKNNLSTVARQPTTDNKREISDGFAYDPLEKWTGSPQQMIMFNDVSNVIAQNQHLPCFSDALVQYNLTKLQLKSIDGMDFSYAYHFVNDFKRLHPQQIDNKPMIDYNESANVTDSATNIPIVSLALANKLSQEIRINKNGPVKPHQVVNYKPIVVDKSMYESRKAPVESDFNINDDYENDELNKKSGSSVRIPRNNRIRVIKFKRWSFKDRLNNILVNANIGQIQQEVLSNVAEEVKPSTRKEQHEKDLIEAAYNKVQFTDIVRRHALLNLKYCIDLVEETKNSSVASKTADHNSFLMDNTFRDNPIKECLLLDTNLDQTDELPKQSIDTLISLLQFSSTMDTAVKQLIDESRNAKLNETIPTDPPLPTNAPLLEPSNPNEAMNVINVPVINVPKIDINTLELNVDAIQSSTTDLNTCGSNIDLLHSTINEQVIDINALEGNFFAEDTQMSATDATIQTEKSLTDTPSPTPSQQLDQLLSFENILQNDDDELAIFTDDYSIFDCSYELSPDEVTIVEQTDKKTSEIIVESPTAVVTAEPITDQTSKIDTNSSTKKPIKKPTKTTNDDLLKQIKYPPRRQSTHCSRNLLDFIVKKAGSKSRTVKQSPLSDDITTAIKSPVRTNDVVPKHTQHLSGEFDKIPQIPQLRRLQLPQRRQSTSTCDVKSRMPLRRPSVCTDNGKLDNNTDKTVQETKRSLSRVDFLKRPMPTRRQSTFLAQNSTTEKPDTVKTKSISERRKSTQDYVVVNQAHQLNEASPPKLRSIRPITLLRRKQLISSLASAEIMINERKTNINEKQQRDSLASQIKMTTKKCSVLLRRIDVEAEMGRKQLRKLKRHKGRNHRLSLAALAKQLTQKHNAKLLKLIGRRELKVTLSRCKYIEQMVRVTAADSGSSTDDLEILEESECNVRISHVNDRRPNTRYSIDDDLVDPLRFDELNVKPNVHSRRIFFSQVFPVRRMVT